MAICSALRVVVPWSRSGGASAATPGLSAGSCAPPARTISAQADGRLLVVRDRDHLQPVRQRLASRTAET